MCDSSWATTPSSSTRLSFSSRPVVTAMAACLGLRPGGEGVGRGVVDDVDARLGQTAGDAQALDEVVQAAVLLGIGGAGPADGEGDGVGLPVRGEGQRRRDHQGDDDAVPAEPGEVPGGGADGDGDEDEAGDEQDGAPLVGADQLEHGTRRVEVHRDHGARSVRTRPSGRCGRPRRPRSTRAARTSARWRRTSSGTAGACCCTRGRCRCRTAARRRPGPRWR